MLFFLCVPLTQRSCEVRNISSPFSSGCSYAFPQFHFPGPADCSLRAKESCKYQLNLLLLPHQDGLQQRQGQTQKSFNRS